MDITPLGVQYEDVKDNNAPPVGRGPELMVTGSSPMTSEARALGRDSPDAVRFNGRPDAEGIYVAKSLVHITDV